jgi:hypothetical protein
MSAKENDFILSGGLQKVFGKYWARCMQEKIKETDKTKTSY